MRAERLSRNSLESYLYKQTLPRDPNKSGSCKKNIETLYVSPRIKLPPSEASRLNIHLLFSPHPPPLLYETSARLIKMIYGQAPFFLEANMPRLEYHIIDQMRLKFPHKAPTQFSDFASDNSVYQDIFYKMLKGTNHYHLQGSGYPPLEDFFTLTPQNSKTPVQFPFASESLLKALFGEVITQSILKEEEKKWELDHKHHTLLADELTGLLNKNRKAQLSVGQLTALLHFNIKRPDLDNTKHKDRATHITIRKPAS